MILNVIFYICISLFVKHRVIRYLLEAQEVMGKMCVVVLLEDFQPHLTLFSHLHLYSFSLFPKHCWKLLNLLVLCFKMEMAEQEYTQTPVIMPF